MNGEPCWGFACEKDWTIRVEWFREPFWTLAGLFHLAKRPLALISGGCTIVTTLRSLCQGGGGRDGRGDARISLVPAISHYTLKDGRKAFNIDGPGISVLYHCGILRGLMMVYYWHHVGMTFIMYSFFMHYLFIMYFSVWGHAIIVTHPYARTLAWQLRGWPTISFVRSLCLVWQFPIVVFS